MISDMLENMTKLETMRLSNCRELQELPHLRKQASLRELCVDGMRFRDVPSSIGDLRKLEVLNIGNELFTSPPTFIENMSSLTRLSISGCEKLESLPHSIRNLSCLTHLSIRGCNKLQSLPDSVGRLNLLKNLYIQNSGVKFLPEALGQLTNLQTLEIIKCPLRELAFRSASSSFFCKLKRISLLSTHLSKISIPEDSCPSLESLELYRDRDLTEINTLPRTVKAISLEGCERLKNFSGIRGLTKLQNLSIYSCPELDELPTLAGLSSIKEISIRDCPKVEKIQGFQHLRSLEVVSAHTCWKESGIKSLEQAERLRRLVLVAESRSAIEPCIQTLRKWPGELLIRGRAVCDVRSVVESLAFSDLVVIDSPYETSNFVGVQCPESHQFNALIVCFVIYSSNQAKLWLESDREKYGAVVVDGMWAVIGMFTADDCSLMSREFNMFNTFKTEKGMLVTGQEWRVREAFSRLLALPKI